jgi:predicted Rossmann-fold nucleotide-binding protein
MTTEMNDGGNIASTRWVMVAGTGLIHGTPTEDVNVAKAVGAELARYRYGLITGGWPGVDYIATESFINQIIKSGLNPEDHLIQVISEGRSADQNVGKIVRTSYGPNEWLEPQKYADAVIIIGGRGGTYKTWLGAVHDGLPRFPIGGAQGDSALAFHQTQEMWEVIPVPGITFDQFSKLAQSVDSQEAADAMAKYVVGELLWRSLNAVDSTSKTALETAPSIFISYSRKDSNWVSRLRTLMRPAERRGLLSSWVDSDIEPGLPWENQLVSKLDNAHAALLLVSPSLLESKYIREIEIPAFINRLKAGRFHLFWTLLEECEWQGIPELQKIQAIGNVKTAISASPTKSDEQCRLIDVVEKITKILAI